MTYRVSTFLGSFTKISKAKMDTDSDNEMVELISDLVVKDVDICGSIEPLKV